MHAARKAAQISDETDHPGKGGRGSDRAHLPGDTHCRNISTAGAMRMMETVAGIPGGPDGGALVSTDQEEEIPQEALPEDQADRAARPWIQDPAVPDKK